MFYFRASFIAIDVLKSIHSNFQAPILTDYCHDILLFVISFAMVKFLSVLLVLPSCQ